MTKVFYEKNDWLLNHEVNKTFEEVMCMTDDEFVDWFVELRKAVLYAWDELGLPPRVGYNEEDIKSQFKKMYGYPVHEFQRVDEFSGESDVIKNNSSVGNAANQWFPTMMKTRINYNANDDGLSIYDHFKNDDLLEKTLKYARRHFKRDSFYSYSLTVKVGETITVGSLNHTVTDAKTFIEWFENKARVYDTHDYWIDERKPAKYSGYKDSVANVKFLELTKKELLECNIPDTSKTNVKEYNDNFVYQIRIFKKGQKLFPAGFKAFRISWCQYAVNFPPLTAKFLYEKFTNHIEDQDTINIYDPSSGWGGRILGAMSVRSKSKIHYIGTDPNPDHTIYDEAGNKTTKYNDIATFYNRVTNEGVLFKKYNTFDIYQLGSEVIGKDKNFKKYKGKLDLVFTSPPYFSKEAYSDDDNQSYKKFSNYEDWREGFLAPTLRTAVEYLKSDRYLLWNIADIQLGKHNLPLEEDSVDILKNLGMEYQGILKMALARMPGQNRINPETGEMTAKNSCKVDGFMLKYEPIYVFYKPNVE